MKPFPLDGCTSEPLAAYLKALAVLRLVAEGPDPCAKGAWKDHVFHLSSVLDQGSLVRFFLDEYSPTAIVAPWNGASGFYEGDSVEGRDAILSSTSARFQLYRRTIEAIRVWSEMPATDLPIGEMANRVLKASADKKEKAREKLLAPIARTWAALEFIVPLLAPDDPVLLSLTRLEEHASRASGDRTRAIKALLKEAKKLRTVLKQLGRSGSKETIVQACRDRLHARVVEWLDAAVTIGPDGDLGFPPLLGSAGNEGHLDYSNAFMQRVAAMLLNPGEEARSEQLLRNALFGTAADGFVVASIGQHDPGRAGGYNQGPAIETKDVPTNPWNFILAIEGTIVWASGVARRQGAGRTRFLCSPFTVNARPVGYSSSANTDGDSARAEVWAPLWNRPLGYSELRAFLSEGRAEVGRRRATHAIEFAEAATSLGVDRGVTSFVRYSLLKRRGDSYVALPAGRFAVQARTESDLLRELDPILNRVDRFLRSFKAIGQEAPARFVSARRSVDIATFELLLHGGAPRVTALVAALGRLEQLFATRDLTKKPRLHAPLSGLSLNWLAAADDGSVEVRIAAALASIGRTGDVGPLRANLAPVDPARPWTWCNGRGQTGWMGNALPARLARVLARRMMDGDRLGCRSNPVWAVLTLHPVDVAAFIEGAVDDSLVEDLLFGFTWLQWSRRDSASTVLKQLLAKWASPVGDLVVPRTWALLKLLFLPKPVQRADGTEVNVRPEPSIVPQLCAGRIRDACEIAERRLRSSGLPVLRSRFPDAGDGIRLAAALLLPSRRVKTMQRMILERNDGEH
jgi:CRISPR-associated protein Csx17